MMEAFMAHASPAAADGRARSPGRPRRAGWRLGLLVLAVLLPGSVLAQSADTEPCTGLVSRRDALIQPAAAVQAGEVGITFIGHATFFIESPGGVKIATDYNDVYPLPAVPDVVTMNHAHSTHFTNQPDPRIKFVLKGWDRPGVAARHDLSVGDVRIRNVPTNIRNWGGGDEEFGNSIFVFEVGGLCVAHLGHLHHTLLPAHLKQLGRIDVLLVPVDGSYTMDVEGMVEVMQAIHAPLMIPMHIFGEGTLQRFLARVGQTFPVKRAGSPELVVSRQTLPPAPEILVLPGR
ncbi:MAG: MBL fold metallo-hydrolase [Alsobacter sp.]